jgi:hypothetical protein
MNNEEAKKAIEEQPLTDTEKDKLQEEFWRSQQSFEE